MTGDNMALSYQNINGSSATKALAMFGVMVFLLSACAVMPDSDVEAAASPVPKGGDYTYIMTYDDNNILITNVEVWEGTTKVDNDKTFRQKVDGKWKMGEYWGYDKTTGLGPFNSFYAAINLYSGANADDKSEARLNTDTGGIAYVLNPSNLKSTLAGASFTGSLYNIMLVIPTVYWVADANHLYISNRDISNSTVGSYHVPSGMKAYAHIFNDKAEFTNAPMAYLAIGVYEASKTTVNGKDALVSQSGATPVIDTNDKLRGYANDTPAGPNADYQQWNFFHWTLYKIMSYTVLGTKNVQAMVGHGAVSLDAAPDSGLSDGAGWVGASSDYSKLFLENTWGGANEMIGDAYMRTRILKVGNLLGGDGLPSDNEKAWEVFANSSGHITKAHTTSKYWDLPETADGNESFKNDYGTVEESMISDATLFTTPHHHCIRVGGGYTQGALCGISAIDGRSDDRFGSSAAGRLSYAMGGFSVTYSAGEGTGSVTDTGKYAAGMDAVLKSDDGMTAPEGKRFVGWSINGTAYPRDTGYRMPSGNVTLTAVWDDAYTEFVFDRNGGTGEHMSNQSIGSGMKTMLSKCSYSRERYSFAGWSDTPGGDALYTDGQILTLEAETSETRTLYAVWEGLYTVSFDVGKGSKSAPESFERAAGTVFFMPDYKGTVWNHEFSGWTDGVAIYQPWENYRLGHADVVFKAVWTAEEIPEEEEDDILLLLGQHPYGSSDGRSFLWIVVAVSAVAVAAAAVMVVALRKPRSASEASDVI